MHNPNDIQYGGNHYKANVEHWDFMVMLGFGYEYFIAAATKYVTRYHRTEKDGSSGELAVQKAIHYIDKLTYLVNTGALPNRFRTTQGFRLNLDAHPGLYHNNVNTETLVHTYLDANNVKNEHARRAIEILCEVQTEADLVRARIHLQALLDSLRGGPPQPLPLLTAAERATASATDAAAALGADASPDYVNQDQEST